MQIRRLLPADAALYRDIRLEALRLSPEAFGSTFERENAQTLEWFAQRLGNSDMFGAFYGAEIVGTAGLLFGTGRKEEHKGRLVGMYVRPDARKSGVGRRLVEAILDFARPRIEIVQLAVVSENHKAIRLYASLGFVAFGLEKNSLKEGGRYYDEVHMANELRSA
ncbi:MAG: GNAT family N-acetyltransferase [Candidatus Acidiferrum sp.]|jgi:ribosomal protein S18 acetylase RimI-like enzyme